MNTILSKQTAIITGASSGIGQGIAIAMARAGANVVINYHSDEQGAAETLKVVEDAGGKGIIYEADVSSEEGVTGLFAEAKKVYGTVDILVNNAGIQKD